MKNLKNIAKGFQATGYLEYLNDIPTLIRMKSKIETVEDLLNLDKLDEVLRARSAFKCFSTM